MTVPDDSDEIFVPELVDTSMQEPFVSDLDEMQFELLPNESAATGFRFGIGTEMSINEDGFDPGSLDWTVQDSDDQQTGVARFGDDFLTGPTWAWQAHADRQDTQGALETLNRAATAWRAREVAGVPGAVMPLRYRVGDRVRRIYGRARRFSHAPTNRILGGYLPITCDFRAVDSYVYDDDLDTMTLTPRLHAASGLTFPLTFPLTASLSPNGHTAVFVGGDAPAYPVITFNGPAANPALSTSRWRLELLNTPLAAGDQIVVDTRPWAQTVMKNGSENVAGALGRKQWLVDIFLEPGAEEHFTFSTTSSGSTGSCQVEWRSCYNAL